MMNGKGSNGLTAIVAAIGGIFVAMALTLIIVATIQNATKTEQIPDCLGSGIHRILRSYVPDGYCAFKWAEGLSKPRGMVSLDNGDILVVEQNLAQITVLWDDDEDGLSSLSERAVLASAAGLNHGITVSGGYLYASSDTTVYRWPFQAGTRTNLGNPQIVIQGMPAGGHATRTLVIDSNDQLYVSVGSAGNVDPNSSRANIKKFNLLGMIFPADWTADGTIFADGLRNEVGLRLDSDGVLWGVENGIDDLNRAPWGDIHIENPAEELNYLGNTTNPATFGKFYGYPYCWSEGILTNGKGAGSQWAFNITDPNTTYTDSWCQNTSNVVPPSFTFPAHVAPLDILFYYGNAFTNIRHGDAFVTWHGSWDRVIQKGFKVVMVRFDPTTRKPVSWKNFFSYAPLGTVNGQSSKDYDPSEWTYRPVGLAYGKNWLSSLGEALYVTDDTNGIIIGIAKKMVEFDAVSEDESSSVSQSSSSSPDEPSTYFTEDY